MKNAIITMIHQQELQLKNTEYSPRPHKTPKTVAFDGFPPNQSQTAHPQKVALVLSRGEKDVLAILELAAQILHRRHPWEGNGF